MHICPGCGEMRSAHVFRLHWHTVKGRDYVHVERKCKWCEARGHKARRLRKMEARRKMAISG